MKMGSGMTVFLREEVKTMDEWDEVNDIQLPYTYT